MSAATGWAGGGRRAPLLATWLGMTMAVVLLAPGAAQVTLPLERYEELRTRAQPAETVPTALPAPWAAEDVELQVDAGETRARVVTTWHVTLFSADWQSLPFRPSGSIVSADFGGAEGRVDASSGWSLRLRGAGRHVIRLESVVPVERDATATRPTWRFVLHVPLAAAAHGRLVALPAVEETGVEGGGLLFRSTSSASRETALVDGAAAGPQRAEARHAASAGASANEWTLLARPGQSLTIMLAGKAATPQRTLLPLRFEAGAATIAMATRTSLTLRAWIEARVLQGRLDELRVPLPEGFDVANVAGPAAGWKTVEHDLVVTPPAPVESSWQITVTLTASPRPEFASPILVPEGATRVRSYCAATARGGGLASIAETGSARAAEPDDLRRLPETLRAEADRFYAVPDRARPPHFQIAWAEGTEVLAAQIDRLLVEVAIGDAGRASYRVWAEVRNRGAQQLVFDLPQGFELAAAARDEVEVRAGRTGNAFALPLAASARAQVVRLPCLCRIRASTRCRCHACRHRRRGSRYACSSRAGAP